jgi:DNA-binding NtrC family response regulator
MREQIHTQEFDFTDDAWQLLEMLHWEENVDQLKRLVQTLVQVTPLPRISLELLEAYLPPQKHLWP